MSNLPPKTDPYPLHTKLKGMQDQTIAISNFLDWLIDLEGYSICRYDEDREAYVWSTSNKEALIGGFTGIDPKELAAEKDRIYADFMNGQITPTGPIPR